MGHKLTPQEADLRLSKARTLADKHLRYNNENPGDDFYTCEVAEVADLIDDVCAARDATIASLRKQLNEEIREAQRDARDAYAQGNWDGREAERGNY